MTSPTKSYPGAVDDDISINTTIIGCSIDSPYAVDGRILADRMDVQLDGQVIIRWHQHQSAVHDVEVESFI